MARTKNPNVGALLTEGGGHVGFASYARDWFYSVILSFFDPVRGAEATVERADDALSENAKK